MFEELLDTLDEYQKFGSQLGAIQDGILEATTANAKVIAEGFAYRALKQAASDAIAVTDEFQYPLLRDHLLRNLEDPRHYVAGDATLRIFDEAAGGTIADLKEGQEAAWKSNAGTPEQRLFCWTYGIYKPAREGGLVKPKDGRDRFEDYPSYREIINIRLGTWGDKAPYWIFLEHGNQGEQAYPTFSGTGFIAKVRARADEFMNTATEVATKEMRRQLEAAIGELVDTGVAPPVFIGRIPFGQTPAGQLAQVDIRRKTRAGGVYYQLVIGGRYGRGITPGEFISEVGKVFQP